MNALPRIDVGYSAMVAAVAALITLCMGAFLQGVAVDWFTVLPPLLVVVVMGLVAYAVESAKEWAGTVAGGLLVIVQAIVSVRRGEVVDMALVTTAVTYFVNLFFLWVIPRIQPRRSGFLGD